ncbi:terminase small subunit [Ligilactobacillus acidipiscis]|uniref:terminase small subunit n=1 Tax=Ligilactobacillus acidipiscis TaxID=89059 RepID=UPI0022E7E453|nr:terminase small subunit [Ligilactobacillus acidipiscis]
MARKLTVKQQKFVDEYIESGNATESAINAGYSKKTAGQVGSENLKKLEIKNAIDKRLEEIKTKKTADITEVMEYLTETMRGEQTETVATAKGLFTDVEVGAKDRIKAAELIGKRYGAWTDKVENTNKNIEIDVGEWNDED